MMQIFQGDLVQINGLLGLTSAAGAPNSTSSITQVVMADFISSKNYGASYALVVVGPNGRKVSKAEGVIVAASGTIYPTH